MKLQNPDVLVTTDVGYCMDKSGTWYRWGSKPHVSDRDIWDGAGPLAHIAPKDAPIVLPEDSNWKESWVDNPDYVKPEAFSLPRTMPPPLAEQIEDMDRLMDSLKPHPDIIFDEINKAKHYNQNPSGVECIEVIEHFQCNVAMAIKYLWRCDLKHDDILIDLRKAEYYVKREIQLREKADAANTE